METRLLAGRLFKSITIILLMLTMVIAVDAKACCHRHYYTTCHRHHPAHHYYHRHSYAIIYLHRDCCYDPDLTTGDDDPCVYPGMDIDE